jgi:hypothetical protein
LVIHDDDAGGDATVTIQAADATGTPYTLTLPPDDGDAGEQLQTDGAGALTWEAAGAGASLPVPDTTSIAEGSADDTKEVRFEVDGLTTGTVRVLTMPDEDINLLPGSDFATAAEGDLAVTALQDITSEVITGLSDVTGTTGADSVVVMQASPTLTTPTIADLTNATHDHADAAGGGTVALSNLSDVTGKTGSDSVVVFQTTPTLTTPIIGNFTSATHDHSNASNAGNITEAAITIAADAVLLGNDNGVTQQAQELTKTEALALLNVEDGADVTDATNVAAATAVMDADFSAAQGMMHKTGSGAYEAIRDSLTATTSPSATDDSDPLGFAVGSLWIDVTGDSTWMCVDATNGAAVWRNTTRTGAGGSGAFSDAGDPIVQNTTTKDVHVGAGAGTLTGKFEVGADADQPQVVIEANATQTDDVVIVQNSADTEVLSISKTGSVFLNEKAAADADVAGKGQFWTKTATPNEPYFTDDAGNDHGVWTTFNSGQPQTSFDCIPPQSASSYTNQAAADRSWAQNWRAIFRVDATEYTECRLVKNQTLAGFAGASLRVKFTTAAFGYSTTVSDYAHIAATDSITLALDTTGFSATAWTAVVDSAKADIYVGIFCIDGDGVADPQLAGGTQIQLR